MFMNPSSLRGSSNDRCCRGGICPSACSRGGSGSCRGWGGNGRTYRLHQKQEAKQILVVTWRGIASSWVTIGGTTQPGKVKKIMFLEDVTWRIIPWLQVVHNHGDRFRPLSRVSLVRNGLLTPLTNRVLSVGWSSKLPSESAISGEFLNSARAQRRAFFVCKTILLVLGGFGQFFELPFPKTNSKKVLNDSVGFDRNFLSIAFRPYF